MCGVGVRCGHAPGGTLGGLMRTVRRAFCGSIYDVSSGEFEQRRRTGRACGPAWGCRPDTEEGVSVVPALEGPDIICYE